MASTRTDIPNIDLSGGLVSAEPPLLKQGEWYKQQNVRWDPEKRRLVGMPYLVSVSTIDAFENVLILPSRTGTFIPILVSYDGVYFTFIGNTPTAFQLTDPNGAAFGRTVSDGTKGSDWPLWGMASTRYSGYIWLTDEFNSIFRTDGTCCYRYTDEAQPAGRYLMSFFDHLVIGWPTYEGFPYPWRVMWSDLYGPNRWAPAQGRECDHFDLDDWGETLPVLQGITGLAKSRDQGWVFTSNSIVRMSYVGLPKVMQFASFVDDIGCTAPRSLVSFNSIHYFYNVQENNFFAFDGQSVRPIGDSIKEFMRDNVVPGISFFYDSCVVVDERYNEIQWFFSRNQPGATVATDAAIAYNTRTGRWHEITNRISNRRIQSAAQCNLALRKNANALTGNADALTGVMERLGLGYSQYTNFYSTGPYGVTPTLYQTVDSWSSGVGFGAPLLETGDRFYGDLYTKKETDAITIHGSATGGMKVSLSVRENLNDSVTFTQVGIFSGTEPQNRLTFPRKSGRIFRWRFESASAVCKDFVLQAFVEHIYGAKSEE